MLAREHAGRIEWAAAIPELTTAITLDPRFAAAYAYLSMARTWQGFMEPQTHAENAPLALDAANKALALDPTLPEGHLAMAVYLYRGAPDIDRAAAEFERAIAGLPNDAVALLNFSFLRRWQGRWEDATALAARAAELDPHGQAPKVHILNLVFLGRRDEAARALAAAIAAQPDDVELAMWPGYMATNFSCDLRTTERVFRDAAARFPESPDMLVGQAYLALQTGDASTALGLLGRVPGDIDASQPERSWLTALAYRNAGKRRESEEQARRFLQAAQRALRDVPAGEQHSDDLAWIALHHALLGDTKAAHEYVDRALKSLPPTGDASNRMETLYRAAIALAWSGDRQRAVAQLRQMLDRRPGQGRPIYGVTRTWRHCEPIPGSGSCWPTTALM